MKISNVVIIGKGKVEISFEVSPENGGPSMQLRAGTNERQVVFERVVNWLQDRFPSSDLTLVRETLQKKLRIGPWKKCVFRYEAVVS